MGLGFRVYHKVSITENSAECTLAVTSAGCLLRIMTPPQNALALLTGRARQLSMHGVCQSVQTLSVRAALLSGFELHMENWKDAICGRRVDAP